MLIACEVNSAIPESVIYENVGSPSYVFNTYRDASTYYTDPNEACAEAAPKPGVSGVGYRYDDPQFGEKEGYGWGCFFYLKYIRFETGEVIYDYPDTFYQNWVGTNVVCPGEGAFYKDGSCYIARPLWEDSCPVGNPVYIGSGVKLQREVDYLSSEFDIGVERVYRSKNQYDSLGIFGVGWALSVFESHLKFESDYYGSDTDFVFVNISGEKSILFESEGVGWKSVSDHDYSFLSDDDGYLLERTDKTESYRFSSEGSLLQVVNNRGGSFSLIYGAADSEFPGLLVEISGSSGSNVQFQYNDSGFVQSLSLNNEILFRYEYDGDRLVKRSDLEGNWRNYLHEEGYSPNPLEMLTNGGVALQGGTYVVGAEYPGNIFFIEDDEDELEFSEDFSSFTGNFDKSPLTGIADNGERISTYKYDGFGRVVSSGDMFGEDKFSYESNKTTVENRLMKTTEYSFVTFNNRRLISAIEGAPSENCAAANKAYTYDSNGFSSSETDWKGNKTTYTRDDLGRELTRTEASGTPEARLIITEWHETLNLPKKVITAESITEYNYDSEGRLLDKKVVPVEDS
ncbi:DUF6531 domain-containing protein [Microbulbifer sp. ZKSA006]|uniref:DUF6531 domain-containing protein n=1 Tax=Microbulbifer sp. ZKSA006 TaxID=3243390 RepID=UPI004039D000